MSNLVLGARQKPMALKLKDTRPHGLTDQLDESHVVGGCDAVPPDSLVSGDLDLHDRVSSWSLHAPELAWGGPWACRARYSSDDSKPALRPADEVPRATLPKSRSR
jgi:hypothetical protein